MPLDMLSAAGMHLQGDSLPYVKASTYLTLEIVFLLDDGYGKSNHDLSLVPPTMGTSASRCRQLGSGSLWGGSLACAACTRRGRSGVGGTLHEHPQTSLAQAIQDLANDEKLESVQRVTMARHRWDWMNSFGLAATVAGRTHSVSARGARCSSSALTGVTARRMSLTLVGVNATLGSGGARCCMSWRASGLSLSRTSV